MVDPTTQLWRDYYAQAARKAEQTLLNKYGVACPECGEPVLLPWDDYLCSDCRRTALTRWAMPGIIEPVNAGD